MMQTAVLHTNGSVDLVTSEQNGTGIWVYLHEKGSPTPTFDQGKNNLTEREFHASLRRRYPWSPLFSTEMED